jgi:hypothetical protein
MKKTTTMRHAFSRAGAASWIVGVAVLLLAGCAAPMHSSSTPRNHAWTKDEVSDSYVFGYPLVVMTSARAAAAAGQAPGAGVNTLRRQDTLPAADDAGLLPHADVDTLASTAWLDLSAEPMVLLLPNTRGEYLDARALDLWTNVVWSTGKSANARGFTKPSAIAFVAPGWDRQLPADVERVDASGTSLWLSVRFAATGPREVPAARRLQSLVRLEPLSAFVEEHGKLAKGGKRLKAAKRAESDSDGESIALADTPAAQTRAVAALDPDAFFGRLADALRDNPPSAAEAHEIEILADLGVKPGEAAHLPRDAADAIKDGIADAHARLASAPVNALSGNGWTWLADGVGHYADDYALRAYATFTRPGSGTKEDDIVATTSVDAQGEPLDGDNRYILHFSAKALPPVRGFWTLTAYTADGALADGRLPHLSVASRDGLRRNRDGSVDIYVQSASPGRARQVNWVPAPKGPFELVLRLYAPQTGAADGNWQPPALVRK